MEKEFVPYKIALALKELGFDEPCFSTYNLDKKVSRNPSHNMEDLPIEGQPYYWQNSKIHVNCITAPLYQQAFRWFREKYKLFDSVNHDHRNETDVTPYFYMIDDCPSLDYKVYRSQEDFDIQKTLFYKSYEEAELECLKKLIEIVKNK